MWLKFYPFVTNLLFLYQPFELSSRSALLCGDFWHQKTRVVKSLWAVLWHYLRDPVFSRFSRTPTCDIRTERHTTTANTCVGINVKKNQKNCFSEFVTSTLVGPCLVSQSRQS